MSPAKKKKPSLSVPRWLRSFFSWLLGPGRPALVMTVLLGVFGGGWYLAWRRVGPRILGSPEYRVEAKRVEITPLPDWIHSDVRAEVFRYPTLDGPLSLVDDDLTERVSRAFSLHPWVAKVRRVGKQYPASTDQASVKVELVYRKPVCMVEVPGGLLPVDAEGILLPSGDFSPSEAARYPRLTGVERPPARPAGKRWPDAKVIGGAEIAAALGPAWEAMKLRCIVPLAADPAGSAAGGSSSGRRSTEPFFALTTHGGTRILWGYAPGANAVGELSAVEKVARLQRHLADHDTLDGRQGQRRELDVRALSPSVGR